MDGAHGVVGDAVSKHVDGTHLSLKAVMTQEKIAAPNHAFAIQRG